MKNLVIIGASELQLPLIERANDLGYSTHVFAWGDGAVGFDKMARFYDIDIKDVDKIYNIVKGLNPVGVCTIASDLANITVHKLASRLNLPHNSEHCLKVSTNKFAMRKELYNHKILCPKFLITGTDNIDIQNMNFPIIVKPTDRSGSRAITKVKDSSELKGAIMRARDISFEKRAIVEEYIEGDNEWVYEVKMNGRSIPAGTPVPIGATLTLVVGNGHGENMADSLGFFLPDSLIPDAGPAPSESTPQGELSTPQQNTPQSETQETQPARPVHEDSWF